MKIIDLHTHLRRDYEHRRYFVAEQLEDLQKNKITLRMISALRGKSVADQNRTVLQLAETEEAFLPCAVLNPKDEGCPSEMNRVWAEKRFRAVELDPIEHGYIPEITPNIDDIFAVCGEQNRFIKLLTGKGDRTLPGQWEYYIRRHEETKVVLLHLGGMWDGYSAVDLASRYPNVYLDTSECFELSLFREALRAVPKDRILFGSGFPERFTECSLSFFDAFPELTHEDKALFYHKNAEALLEMEI